VPREEPFGCDSVGGRLIAPLATPRREQLIRQRAIYPLARQLLAEGTLPTRPCSIAGLDPGARKSLVVEDADLDQAADGFLDQLGPITCVSQPAANLGD
jgi:hypothetical protein